MEGDMMLHEREENILYIRKFQERGQKVSLIILIFVMSMATYNYMQGSWWAYLLYFVGSLNLILNVMIFYTKRFGKIAIYKDGMAFPRTGHDTYVKRKPERVPLKDIVGIYPNYEYADEKIKDNGLIVASRAGQKYSIDPPDVGNVLSIMKERLRDRWSEVFMDNYDLHHMSLEDWGWVRKWINRRDSYMNRMLWFLFLIPFLTIMTLVYSYGVSINFITVLISLQCSLFFVKMGFYSVKHRYKKRNKAVALICRFEHFKLSHLVPKDILDSYNTNYEDFKKKSSLVRFSLNGVYQYLPDSYRKIDPAEINNRIYGPKKGKAKRRATFVVLFVVLFVGLMYFTVWRAPGLGTSDAPETYDLSIVEEGGANDTDMVLRTNLYVPTGKTVTLENVNLTFDCSSHGKYGIYVDQGAELILENCTITSMQAKKAFTWEVYGSMFMDNCTVSHVWADKVADNKNNNGGIELYSDDVVIYGSTISDCKRNGILIARDGVLIRNSIISDCGDDGIEINRASPRIINCTISDNDFGIFVIYDGKPIIEGCTIMDNSVGIGVAYGADSQIRNCTITDNDRGFSQHWGDSSDVTDNNEIDGNGNDVFNNYVLPGFELIAVLFAMLIACVVSHRKRSKPKN